MIRITHSRDPKAHAAWYEAAFPSGDGNKKPSQEALTDGVWFVAKDGARAVAWASMEVTSSRTADFLGCWVAPDYRGYGLQRKLIAKRLAFARAAGVKEVTSHVLAGNTYSLNNQFWAGFHASGARQTKIKREITTFLDLTIYLGGTAK